MTAQWFNVILQGGSFALIAWIVVYGAWKWRNDNAADRAKDVAQFTKELGDHRVQHLADSKESREAYIANTDSQREEYKTDLADQRKESKANMDLVLATFKSELAAERASREKALETFKAESAAERAACEKHFETLANAVGKGNEATIQAVKTMAEQIQQHALRNQQWASVLQEAVKAKQTEERPP